MNRPGFVLAIAMTIATVAHAQVKWICSTEEQPWRTIDAPEFVAADPAKSPEIRIAPHRTFQTIDGFGGCFNELGWQALETLPEGRRAEVLGALFGDEGCGFTLARVPIGASDFALDWYSLDDMPGDLDLREFSIERDRRMLLHYIKAAMDVRPELKCWGSPWSPPAWMKTNGDYSEGSLRWEPEILRAYALYLVKWIEAYRGEGVNVYGLSPQNEPNILNKYPTCLWTGPQLREFIADYLGPALREHDANVELWLGLNGDPSNGGENINDRLVTVLKDERANAFITGVAFQYDSRNQIAAASALYPDKKFMQSETMCHNGDNTWDQAQQLYSLMKRYLEGGANAYFAWNMVLDETGESTWDWRQNALVTVNRDTGEVTYNGEYYVMRHFSQFVRPGAKRAMMTGVWGDQIGFVNADGSRVLVLGNSADEDLPVRVCIGDHGPEDTLSLTLPAKSVNTIVIPR